MDYIYSLPGKRLSKTKRIFQLGPAGLIASEISKQTNKKTLQLYNNSKDKLELYTAMSTHDFA